MFLHCGQEGLALDAFINNSTAVLDYHHFKRDGDSNAVLKKFPGVLKFLFHIFVGVTLKEKLANFPVFIWKNLCCVSFSNDFLH